MGNKQLISDSSYRTIGDVRWGLFKRARERAKKKNIPFNITIKDIHIPEVCPIMKVPLVANSRYSPSLDKKDPNLGYTKGNVAVISMIANNLKGNASYAEVKIFSKNILKYLNYGE
jgi:hypothetical protein